MGEGAQVTREPVGEGDGRGSRTLFSQAREGERGGERGGEVGLPAHSRPHTLFVSSFSLLPAPPPTPRHPQNNDAMFQEKVPLTNAPVRPGAVGEEGRGWRERGSGRPPSRSCGRENEWSRWWASPLLPGAALAGVACHPRPPFPKQPLYWIARR